jgi:hypothetical protein
MFEIKPHSVHLKMYRAREHYESLEEELEKFFSKRIDETKELERVGDVVAANESANVPLRIPIIIGDCLQNMRSALDYLVWELVKVNGRKPNRNNMFPICLTEEAFHKAIDGGRLRGIHRDANTLIKQLQPYHTEEASRKRHVLSVLDALSNINKHRHVIATPIHHRLDAGKLPPRHFMYGLFSDQPKGVGVVRGQIISYIAFEEKPVQRIEVAAGIDMTFLFLVEQVFRRFEVFFQ